MVRIPHPYAAPPPLPPLEVVPPPAPPPPPPHISIKMVDIFAGLVHVPEAVRTTIVEKGIGGATHDLTPAAVETR